MLRQPYASTYRCLSSYSRKKGIGGVSEEKAIAQAIRSIKDKQFNVVVEVMNACHVDWADRNLPARQMMQRNANVWIRVLTHSDLLSKEALKYQIKRASYISSISENIRWNKKSNYQVPVVALNLKEVTETSSKERKFRTVMEMLLGARNVSSSDNGQHQKILICGLPNAGKSSLIYPLTKNRTLQVKKKKKSHHLPSINSTAGWTMGTKSHVFDIKVEDNHTNRSHKTESVTLIDTPGLRPKLEDIGDGDELATWLATQSTKPQKGMFSKSNPNYESLKTKIVDILWQGIKRHKEIKGKPLTYKSPDDLWKFHEDRHGDGQFTLDYFIETCTSGEDYGRMVIETHPIGIDAKGEPMLQYSKTDEHGQEMTVKINSDSTIVAMNPSALMLTNIGGGRLQFDEKEHSQVFLPPLQVYTSSKERNHHYRLKYEANKENNQSQNGRVRHDDTHTKKPIDSKGKQLTDTEIENLIHQRTQYKRNREFDQADKIQNLLRQSGVRIYDDKEENKTHWFVEKLNEFGHFYSRIGGRTNKYFCDLSDTEINNLIRTRMQCRMKREFKLADEIQETLRGCGVFINDETKEWRADGVNWKINGSRRKTHTD